MTLFSIIIANIIISLGSIIGLIPVLFKRKNMSSILIYLVALSAGTLIGDAFIHLLPEAAETLSSDSLFLTVLLAFIGFFIIEKFFHWRHCHSENCEEHSFGVMNLLGDGIHNFIDGLIIAAAFSVDMQIGIVTTIAVALHEIPQEIGDFGVLLHAGWSKRNALIANISVATMSILGGIVGYFMAQSAEEFALYLVPIAAGGFIYIGASDLLPELRKKSSQNDSILTLMLFLLGVGLMYLLKFVE